MKPFVLRCYSKTSQEIPKSQFCDNKLRLYNSLICLDVVEPAGLDSPEAHEVHSKYSPDEEPSMQEMVSKHGFSDAWTAVNDKLQAGYTWVYRNPRTRGVLKVPDHRTDYIFFQSGESTKLETTRCQLFGDQPINGMWLSDHFGVLADISVSTV